MRMFALYYDVQLIHVERDDILSGTTRLILKFVQHGVVNYCAHNRHSTHGFIVANNYIDRIGNNIQYGGQQICLVS